MQRHCRGCSRVSVVAVWRHNAVVAKVIARWTQVVGQRRCNGGTREAEGNWKIMFTVEHTFYRETIGGWSLNGYSNVAEGRQTHRHGYRMDAKWLVNGRRVMDAFCCKNDPPDLVDASVSFLPPLCIFWVTSSAYWKMNVAITPMVLSSFCLLRATCSTSPVRLWIETWFTVAPKVAWAGTQKQNYLGLGDRWASR